jgi:hypothetical protein
MSASNIAMACESKPTVFIVDDDAAVRSAVSLLVRSCGWEPRTFASAEAFLPARKRSWPTLSMTGPPAWCWTSKCRVWTAWRFSASFPKKA